MSRETPANLRRTRSVYRDHMNGATHAELMLKYGIHPSQGHRIDSLIGAHKSRLEKQLYWRKIPDRYYIVKYLPISKRAKKALYSIGVKSFISCKEITLPLVTLRKKWSEETLDEIRAYCAKIKIQVLEAGE